MPHAATGMKTLDQQFLFVFHGAQQLFEVPVPIKCWSGQCTTSCSVYHAKSAVILGNITSNIAFHGGS